MVAEAREGRHNPCTTVRGWVPLHLNNTGSYFNKCFNRTGGDGYNNSQKVILKLFRVVLKISAVFMKLPHTDIAQDVDFLIGLCF